MNKEITLKSFVKSYWNYYLELEEHLLSTKRYVEFDPTNNKTFSIEFLKLLQATCSEIDVVGKILAERIDKSFCKIKYKNIQKWGYCIFLKYPQLENTPVCFYRSSEMVPWKNCGYEKYKAKDGSIRYRLVDGKVTPKWWTAYNDVKHERTTEVDNIANYTRANYQNLVSAMAALFLLENILMKELNEKTAEEFCPSPSKLFELISFEEEKQFK